MPAEILSFSGFGMSRKCRYMFEEKQSRTFSTFSHGTLIKLWQTFKDRLKMFKKELKPVGAENNSVLPPPSLPRTSVPNLYSKNHSEKNIHN